MEVDIKHNGCGAGLAQARYSAPRLTLHGDVSQLTAAGSGNAAETNGPGTASTCQSPSRKTGNQCN